MTSEEWVVFDRSNAKRQARIEPDYLLTSRERMQFAQFRILDARWFSISQQIPNVKNCPDYLIRNLE